MYTLEGVSSVVNIITAYDEIKPRIPPTPPVNYYWPFESGTFC